MPAKDLFLTFSAMEKELDLFDIKVDGIKIWERIRIQVFTRIEHSSVSAKIGKPLKKSALTRMMSYPLSLLNLFKNPFLAPKSQLLFVCSYRRFLENDGYWWNIYTDPIIQKFDFPPVTVEEGKGYFHHSPAKTSNLFYTDFIESLVNIKKKLKLVRCHITKSKKKQLNEIRDWIEDKFGIQIDVVSLAVKTLETRKARLPLYQKMLKHIQPELVIIDQGYDRSDFVEACKSLGITIIELQHGIIYSFHPGYAYGKDKKIETFVDYILIWGDYWKKGAHFPISDNNIVSTGFPYMENKLKTLQETPKKKQILFISQPIVSDVLSEFAITLSKKSGFDYRIVYKLHPHELIDWRENYSSLIANNIEVADPQNKTLHELLAESMIQVGACSTAIYEGVAFGLHTYLIDSSGIDLMEILLNNKLARKVANPDELMEYIRQDEKSDEMNTGLFFKENGINNIFKFLSRIIQERNR